MELKYELVEQKTFNYIYQVLVHNKLSDVFVEKINLAKNIVKYAAHNHGLTKLQTDKEVDAYIDAIFQRALLLRISELDAAESLIVLSGNAVD
jgi:hypothetical protein